MHEATYRVHITRKVWPALNRASVEVAWCTVERLMREMGLAGALPGGAGYHHPRGLVESLAGRSGQTSVAAAGTGPVPALWLPVSDLWAPDRDRSQVRVPRGRRLSSSADLVTPARCPTHCALNFRPTPLPKSIVVSLRFYRPLFPAARMLPIW